MAQSETTDWTFHTDFSSVVDDAPYEVKATSARRTYTDMRGIETAYPGFWCGGRGREVKPAWAIALETFQRAQTAWVHAQAAWSFAQTEVQPKELPIHEKNYKAAELAFKTAETTLRITGIDHSMVETYPAVSGYCWGEPPKDGPNPTDAQTQRVIYGWQLKELAIAQEKGLSVRLERWRKVDPRSVKISAKTHHFIPSDQVELKAV